MILLPSPSIYEEILIAISLYIPCIVTWPNNITYSSIFYNVFLRISIRHITKNKCLGNVVEPPISNPIKVKLSSKCKYCMTRMDIIAVFEKKCSNQQKHISEWRLSHKQTAV